MLNLVLISICLILFIYRCVLKNWFVFQRQNIKYIRGAPIFGAMWKTYFGTEPLAKIVQSIYNYYPNEQLIGFHDFAGKYKYFLRDPELMKQIFLKDFNYFINHHLNVDSHVDIFGRSLFLMRDERWKKMRANLIAVFTGTKMRLMFSTIDDISQQYCENFKNYLDTNAITDYDMKDLCRRFVADSTVSCLFGVTIDSLTDRENLLYKCGVSMIDNPSLKSKIDLFFINAMPKVLAKIVRARIITEKDTKFFREMFQNITEYREKNGIVRNDLIDTLMDLKKEMLAASNEDTYNGPKWSDEDLFAQTITGFFVTFVNMSKTISFLIHELTVNPDIQERLRQEILDTEKGLNGKSLTIEDIKKMKYMDMVLSELMRRWNLIVYFERECNKPYTLNLNDGRKIQFNVGDILMTSTLGMHHDPKWFPQPEKFDPERFSDENKANIVNGTFLPFGIGQRYCIATRFARNQPKVFIYHFLKNFQLSMCSRTQHPLQYKIESSITIDGEKDFWVNVKAR